MYFWYAIVFVKQIMVVFILMFKQTSIIDFEQVFTD